MENKVYVVSYTSSDYNSDLYNEVKVASTKDKAQEYFDEYVRDIELSNNTEYSEEILDYLGKNFLDWGDAMAGKTYLVQLTEEKV